jgi:trehalose/maltose transport system substrate-binding protein
MKCRREVFALKVIGSSSLIWRRALSVAGVVAILLLIFVGLEGCGDTAPTPAPVTVTLLDPGWLDKEFASWRKHEEEEFTRETGILVKDLPAPETAIDQLALWRKLLGNSTDAPDVFAIDVIWPALMADYSLPLTPYLSDTSQDFPMLVANDTLDGQLVAMPYHADAGLLFYRIDLLHKYGYKIPPSTWDELEQMATRIQKGERSQGKKDFWGFVWQGAPSEALTCNALEWQASEGGGRIIEADKTISVNNPRTVRAWQRAAGWVGSISPPSVVAYREWDSLNIWHSGNAAFMRNWPTSFVTSENSGVGTKFAATLLPGGNAGRTATLGGASLSVYRNTRHPKEAAALVRYLSRRDVELARAIATSQPPVMPELYGLPEVVRKRPHFAQLEQIFESGVVERPSTVSGMKYEEVSAAYFNEVHAVLTKQKSASQAAADLEVELVGITGFRVRSSASETRDVGTRQKNEN